MRTVSSLRNSAFRAAAFSKETAVKVCALKSGAQKDQAPFEWAFKGGL